MRTKKSWVTVSVAAGLIAGSLAAAAPAMAVQKSCNNGGVFKTCSTINAPIPASATHAITICSQSAALDSDGVRAYDKDTGVQVGHVKSAGALKCTDIGGLFGLHYYIVNHGYGVGYISN